jgi:hypothetical protein
MIGLMMNGAEQGMPVYREFDLCSPARSDYFSDSVSPAKSA